jgi:hypothetical protein
MITRARDYSQNSSIEARRSPSLAHMENSSRDAAGLNTPGTESSDRANASPRLLTAVATASFLVVMAIIGSAAALAWRAQSNLSSIAELQRQDVLELQAAIEHLELVQQQTTQRIDVLQQAQQKTDQSRLGDVQRLSERVSSLQAELEKASSAKQAQKKSSAASTNTASTIH